MGWKASVNQMVSFRRHKEALWWRLWKGHRQNLPEAVGKWGKSKCQAHHHEEGGMRWPPFWHSTIWYTHPPGFPPFLRNTSIAHLYLLSFSLPFESLFKCCLLHEAPQDYLTAPLLRVSQALDHMYFHSIHRACLQIHLPVISCVNLGKI